jgi:hypothetical protein
MTRYTCPCVLAEKPKCGVSCWHFRVQSRTSGSICAFCGNSGIAGGHSLATGKAEKEAQRAVVGGGGGGVEGPGGE